MVIGPLTTVAAVPLLAPFGSNARGKMSYPNHAEKVDVIADRCGSPCVGRTSKVDSPNPPDRKSWFSGLMALTRSKWNIGLPGCHEQRQERERAIAAALWAMDRAVGEVDTVGFFRASRQVVRHRIAGRFNLVADAIAPADAREYLPASRLPDLLEVADCVIYSGQNLPQEALVAWRDRVLSEIRTIEG